MGTQEQLIEFLKSYVQKWPRHLPMAFGRPLAASMADSNTAEEIAADLVSSAAFQAIKFGTWLSTPEGRLVTAAVEAMSPPLMARDIELLVAALDLAIKLERRRRTKELAGKAFVGAGLVAVLVALGASGSGA